MKSTLKSRTFSKAIMCAAIATLAGVSITCAAPAPAPLVNPTGAPAAAPAPLGEGLAGLDDNALGAELSSRGLNSLLDHYFKQNHTSDTQQQAIKTFGALRELRNAGVKISVGDKMARVKQVADGIDILLPSLRDPNEMMNTAATLVEFGVNPDINDIEYWGEDPITQASLKPLADAVLKLMDDASKTARKQADDLSRILKGGNDPNADRWDSLDKLASVAAYSKQMSVYFAAFARTAKDPERAKMATAAATALAEYDNDQFGVQPRVRNMIGKLEMVSGDYTKAKATLATVVAKTGLTPPPNPYEENEARRFGVLCDLLSKDLAAAKTDEAALQTWQTDTMPKELAAAQVPPASVEAGTKANAAGAMMLDWRIHVLEEELAKSAADKTNAENAAEAVLSKLREAHPEMSARILQQLVKRRPTDKPIDEKTEPSLLVALEKRAINESLKAADEKPDLKVINQGIDAARAIVRRKGAPGLSAAEVEEAQLAIANLHNYLGNKVEAANAFLDYAVGYYTVNPTKANQALGAAGYLVMGVMKKMQPNAPAGFAEVYARFLPTAINPPFNHTDLAYQYAEQLRGLKQFQKALPFFRMVPKTDPQYALAKYKEMMALQGLLDIKQEPAEHQQTVTALLAVAEEVKKLNETPTQDYYRNCALDAIGTLAELYTRELKDPNHTLKALDGYETLVAGLSAGKTPAEVAGSDAHKAELIRGAQVLRIKAYMALGKSDDAVQAVTKLLQTAKGDDGINFVKVLLDKLDKDYASADLIHNTAVMKEAARNSALLTGYLVKYSDPATQKDPKVSQWYYAYLAYDATAQRIAGTLADPADAKKLLEAAADRFKLLQSDEMHKLYLEQPEVKKRIAAGLEPTDPDWQAQTGLALTEFALGNYKDARELLNPIISLKKLGTADIQTVDPVTHETVIKPNDLYWEAYYKLLKSDYEVGTTDPSARADGIKMLKGILLLGGVPERWQDEFEDLRKEAIPDFNPDKPVVQKPAAPAPTQPAANAK